MPGNHPLWPDRNSEKLYRLIWMKKHPDGQPRGAIPVHRGDDDDGRDYDDFEGNGIDVGTPLVLNPQITQIHTQKRTLGCGSSERRGSSGTRLLNNGVYLCNLRIDAFIYLLEILSLPVALVFYRRIVAPTQSTLHRRLQLFFDLPKAQPLWPRRTTH